MKRISATNWILVILYLLMVAGISGGLRHYRQVATTKYATPEANANWQDWRDAAEEMSTSGPVTRNKPQAIEPPALLLMRDHFVACLAITLLLSTALFVTMSVFVRGVLKGATAAPE